MGRVAMVASLTNVPSSDGRHLRAVGQAADCLEVRADLAGDLDARWLRSFFPGGLIYSLRSVAAGGAFAGPADERTRRLLSASQHYDMVELETASDLAPELLSVIPPQRRILSWSGSASDYQELAGEFSRFSSIQATLYKLVIQSRRCRDALVSLSLLKSLKRSDVVAFATGEVGFWSRLVALHLGATTIFGSADRSWSADGEPSVFQLIEDYGLPFLSPVDAIFGIVGNPVRHSLSPRMHNAAYRALGYPALFVPFQVESFAEFWRDVVTGEELQSLGFNIRGLTVASPYKEVALPEAAVVSPICRRVGATNVFFRENGQWKADTTDPEGVMVAIHNRGFSVEGRRAAVVGCGGAGRAVAAALSRAGAEVTLVNRGFDRGHMAADLLGLPLLPLSSFGVDGFSILVNATPVGRDDNRVPFELSALRDETLVIDLVYGSTPTPLITEAIECGRPAIDGQEVLFIQVLSQFHKMTGLDMPADVVRDVLRAKLQSGTGSCELTYATQMERTAAMNDQLSMMRSDGKQAVTGEPDLSPLLGTWMNTNPDTDSILKLTVARRNGGIVLRVFGASSPSPVDWGEVEANAYVNGGTCEGVGFRARYDFGEIETFLVSNHKQGILTIQSYTSFRDASGRMNYFAREFFHQ